MSKFHYAEFGDADNEWVVSVNQLPMLLAELKGPNGDKLAQNQGYLTKEQVIAMVEKAMADFCITNGGAK